MIKRTYPATDGVAASPLLLKQVQRAYEDELSAILGYTANSIVLSPYLPDIADLYAKISLTEMEHFRHLGELLRNLGASPYLFTRFKPRAYHLNEDADSHAIVVARRMLTDSAAGEEAASNTYRRMAQTATEDSLRHFFSALSLDEAEHLRAFTATLDQLEKS